MAGKITASEAEVQAACLDYLAMRGHFFFRLNQVPVVTKEGLRRSLPKYTPLGLPDAVVVKAGRFIGIEFKRDGAKLSKEQVECAKNIMKAGGDHHVVRSIDDLVKIGL